MDQRTFGELYEQLMPAVFNHCLRRTGSWSESEELTAMTFLEAWRRADSLGAARSQLAWLVGISNNVMRNRWRSQRRFGQAMGRLAEMRDAAQDPMDDVERRLDAERRVQSVRPALARLPVREREIVELCVGDGLPHEVVAEALQLPIGTVKSRLARGLAKLREAPETQSYRSGLPDPDRDWAREGR